MRTGPSGNNQGQSVNKSDQHSQGQPPITHHSGCVLSLSQSHNNLLSYRNANISCSTAAPALLQAGSMQSFNGKTSRHLSRSESAAGEMRKFYYEIFGCRVAPVVSCYLTQVAISLSLSLSSVLPLVPCFHNPRSHCLLIGGWNQQSAVSW